MDIKQALLGVAISTVAMTANSAAGRVEVESQSMNLDQELVSALDSYQNRTLINQYRDDLLSSAVDLGFELPDAVKEKDSLFVASANDAQNIPSTGGCHTACHSACHGSRGWR